jgi:hypothetical protein
MLNKLKNIYAAIVVIFTVIVLYSTFVFGYGLDREIADWKLTGTKKVSETNYTENEIGKWQKYGVKSSKIDSNIKYTILSTDGYVISPIIKTSNNKNKEIVTYVQVYLKTKSASAKISWSYGTSSKFYPGNSVKSPFFYVKGNYTFVVKGDMKYLKIEPADAKNSNFSINKVKICKYKVNKDIQESNPE